jgi:hypothetical protein
MGKAFYSLSERGEKAASVLTFCGKAYPFQLDMQRCV